MVIHGVVGAIKKDQISKAKLIDLTGRVFGRLTVISCCENRDAAGTVWLCQCICGKTTEVSACNLKAMHTTSCGCFNLENITTHGQSKTLQYRLYMSAKHRAIKDGLPMNITLEDIDIPEFCPITGVRITSGNGSIETNSPTLDKIVPPLGYVLGNVAVISSRANRIKSDGTPEEWYNIFIGLNSKCAIYQENSDISEGVVTKISKNKVKSAKQNASRKCVPFDLTEAHIQPLLKKYCPLLGIPLDYSTANHPTSQNKPSIDRIVPSLGYVFKNVQIVSSRANRLKSDASFQEISNLCDYLDKHLQKESK